MNFLRRPAGWGFVLVLVTLLVCSCTISAYRDFAAVAPTDAPPSGYQTDAFSGQNKLAQPPDSTADLGPLLAEIGERHNIPAFAAAVLRGDRIVAQGVSGVRRRGTNSAVTLDDRFQIASCAKAMSAMLVARLVEEGYLEWDQPVTRYFSGERVHSDWNEVSLRQLITHTAGVRDPLMTFLRSTSFDRGTLMERRLEFARRVLASPPAAPSGAEVVYSNTDYILAAVAAEKATGKPWEQLMATWVFASLGLHSAGFGPPGSPGQTLQPWGHGKYRLLQVGVVGNAAFDPASAEADYPAIASPAGYIHLSIRDWAKFVSLHLRAHPANPYASLALLRPETFATLHGTDSRLSYAGGWNIGIRTWAKGPRAVDTGRVLFHFGDNGRWTSAVWLAPEKDLAVLVVCNRGDMNRAVDEVTSQLVATYARR